MRTTPMCLAIGSLALALAACGDQTPTSAAPPTTPSLAITQNVNECASPKAGWIWCDDFEQDRTSRYFEYDNNGGRFARAGSVGHGGSWGMRAPFAKGQASAGALHLAFGRTPSAYFRAADAGTANYRDIYWRVYVRYEPGWSGGGGVKMSRATVFAGSNWSQAMIAHVWSGKTGTANANYLVVDPASGTDASGKVVTTKYNDFANLKWLGSKRSATAVFDAGHVGQWYCIEAHARLNDAGLANGVEELWINDALEARRAGLNFVGSYSAYGINAVFLENYWNNGSPRAQERVFDRFVVSTQRIGC